MTTKLTKTLPAAIVAGFIGLSATASASYVINDFGATIGGVTYGTSGVDLSGVDLGTFNLGDTLNLTAASFNATALNGGAVPSGATTADNYIHNANGDGVIFKLYIDGAATDTALTLTTDPGSNKGTFEWTTAAPVNVLAGLAAGAHTLSFEADYTFTNWDGANTQINPTDFAPLTSAATFNVAAVPEPSSTALLGLGGLALILRRRK